MLTREQRLEAARARTKQNIDSKNSYGVSGKQVIDWEKIGGWKKELMFKPKAGINHIDIIPFIVTTDRHPQGTKKGYPDFMVDIWVHRFVGASKSSFLCLERMYGKPCPICEAKEKMKNDPDISDKEIKKLNPKRRCIYNVINTDLPEKDQNVQIFEESHFLFESKVIDVTSVKNEFDYWDIELGKTMEFMATEKKSPEGNHLEYSQFFFDKRPAYNESIYEEAYKLDELLHIPTYDEVRNAFLDMDDEVEEIKRTEEPVRKRRTEEPVNEMKEIEEESKQFAEDAGLSRRRERQRPEPVKEENKCPYGHVFGVDNEKFSSQGHCTSCDQKIWNECADEHDRLVERGK